MYATVAGFVQFEPNEREANGRQVRDVVVQAIGSGGKNVRITIWPEHGEKAVERGDLVFAQGKFSQNTHNGTTYLNLSASDLIVIPNPGKSSDEVVNSVDDDSDDDSPF